MLVAGFFLAADPGTYRRGLVMLFPVSHQPLIGDTLEACGRSLRLWLLGELIAMTVVGLLVGVGAWLLDLPAPLALGLIAFATELIPVVGPILGAVPGIILAATLGWPSLLWAIGLYLAVQQLESNVVTPLVERHMTEVPPALLLFAVTAFGTLFGIVGLIVAAPLAVVLLVMVQRLFVREALGQPVKLSGEN